MSETKKEFRKLFSSIAKSHRLKAVDFYVTGEYVAFPTTYLVSETLEAFKALGIEAKYLYIIGVSVKKEELKKVGIDLPVGTYFIPTDTRKPIAKKQWVKIVDSEYYADMYPRGSV
jgi:hypothetical protein